MKHLLESMMDGELENHLNEEKASANSNRRNGKTKKTVRGLNTGTFELETGRDRSGTFEPKVVPKRQLIITEQLEGHVLSMYAKGMSTRASLSAKCMLWRSLPQKYRVLPKVFFQL